jgi:hypothetical protein
MVRNDSGQRRDMDTPWGCLDIYLRGDRSGRRRSALSEAVRRPATGWTSMASRSPSSAATGPCLRGPYLRPRLPSDAATKTGPWRRRLSSSQENSMETVGRASPTEEASTRLESSAVIRAVNHRRRSVLLSPSALQWVRTRSANRANIHLLGQAVDRGADLDRKSQARDASSSCISVYVIGRAEGVI